MMLRPAVLWYNDGIKIAKLQEEKLKENGGEQNLNVILFISRRIMPHML